MQSEFDKLVAEYKYPKLSREQRISRTVAAAERASEIAESYSELLGYWDNHRLTIHQDVLDLLRARERQMYQASLNANVILDGLAL